MFAASYILIWVAFGVLALGFAAGMEFLADRSAWLFSNWARIVGALLVAAGIYQLTPLKHICLRNCRTPTGFLLAHWRDGWSGAFAMGLSHGLYCVGCCWLLMALLFVGGVMNMLWVATLAVLVLLEKLMSGGVWLARGSGVAMLAIAAAMLVRAV